MQLIAMDVAMIPTVISNAYLVGDERAWVLIDALTPGNERKIKEAAEARFGPGAKPRAIVLTHGHFDHAGSAAALADFWGVKVYAHRLEFPYLTGRSSYPPLDPTADGFFSGLSRLFPSSTANLGKRMAELESDRPLPWVDGWSCHYTPGHAPGHVAFFRRRDGVLLAGDAVTTMNLDSLFDTVITKREMCRPPVPGTIDWPQAHASVRALAALRPKIVAAGHGKPIADAAGQLQRLADHFRFPKHGRYVEQPAITDESGVTYLPPAPFDVTPKIAAGLAGALLFAGAVGAFRRNSSRSS